MKELHKLWWIEIVRGALLLILSILILSYPMNAIYSLAVFIGVSLLLTGILEIATALRVKHYYSPWKWGLANGVLEIILALMLLSNPAVTAVTIPFIVGIWLIIHGLMMIGYSFVDKKEDRAGWGVNLVLGLLTTLFGFIITNNTLVGIWALTTWIGLGFLMAGLLNIIIGFWLKPKKKS